MRGILPRPSCNILRAENAFNLNTAETQMINHADEKTLVFADHVFWNPSPDQGPPFFQVHFYVIFRVVLKEMVHFNTAK